MKFKYKVEIVIDEEKVINDDIYEPSEMYEFIRNMFKRCLLYTSPSPRDA